MKEPNVRMETCRPRQRDRHQRTKKPGKKIRKKEYSVINLKTEYLGRIQEYAYAISSWLSREEFLKKYAPQLKRYQPFLYPPHYLVFFKAKDADAMTAAFNEYSQAVLRKEERPSVLEQLRKIKAAILALPGKVINRDKKRELDR